MLGVLLFPEQFWRKFESRKVRTAATTTIQNLSQWWSRGKSSRKLPSPCQFHPTLATPMLGVMDIMTGGWSSWIKYTHSGEYTNVRKWHNKICDMQWWIIIFSYTFVFFFSFNGSTRLIKTGRRNTKQWCVRGDARAWEAKALQKEYLPVWSFAITDFSHLSLVGGWRYLFWGARITKHLPLLRSKSYCAVVSSGVVCDMW